MLVGWFAMAVLRLSLLLMSIMMSIIITTTMFSLQLRPGASTVFGAMTTRIHATMLAMLVGTISFAVMTMMFRLTVIFLELGSGRSRDGASGLGSSMPIALMLFVIPMMVLDSTLGSLIIRIFGLQD
jgi:hypothetical protein